MANAPRLSVVPESSRPKKLGRYELEERLGGDEGVETFRARVRGLAGFDRIFAVKCLHRPRGTQVNLNDPFIKSARRLASLTDPRLARVLDADVIDGVAVAVTEFVHGLDLDRFRECAQFAGVLATGNDEAGAKWQKIVAYVGAEVAGGLSVLHALTPPLVHGGLSPRNIVTTARGGLKILDAGLGASAEVVATARQGAKRTADYAASDPEGVACGPEADVRALGAILFELVTGELPAPGEASATARKVLDSLWPPMAAFVAGMLAEDPASRPSAAEVATILGEFWSDIPDASMVNEMAALVRNFSAFVTEPGVQNTASPIVQGPPPVPEPTPAPADVLSITPPAPSDQHEGSDAEASAEPAAEAEADAAPKRGLFDDEPTVVRESGSYAAALFQAAPTDSEIDESLALAGLAPPPPSARPNPAAGHATLLAYPSARVPEPAPTYVLPEDSISIPLDEVPDSELDAGSSAGPAPEPSMDAAFPALAQSSDAIPELADWGARALASLGDQAGVAVAPLSPSPAVQAATAVQPPPPPVSDPVIEAAFDFMPPPPPSPPSLAQASDEPMLEVQAELDVEPSSSASSPKGSSVGPSLLEDELVDESTGPGAEALPEPALEAQAFESPAAEVAQPTGGLAATAFPEGESSPAEPESPRLVHAMPAPQESAERHPKARSATRSSAANVLGEVEAEALANSTRGRRIAIAVGLFLLVGGAAGGGLSAFGVFGDKHHAPIGKISHSSHTVAPSAHPTPAQAGVPVAKVEAKAVSAPVAKAKVEAPAASAAKAKVETQPLAAAAAPVPAPATSSPVAPDKPAPSGPTVSVSVTSTPAGATVWIDGEERGITPCSVKVGRGATSLTLVLAGHVSKTSALDAAEGKTIAHTLQAVEPPVTGEARFRAECTTKGKLPIVVDGRETGVLCPYSKLRVEPGPHSIGVLIPATGKVHAKEITLPAGVRSIVFAD